MEAQRITLEQMKLDREGRGATVVNKALLRLSQSFLDFGRSQNAARQTRRNPSIFRFPPADDDGNGVLVDGRLRELFQPIMICDQVHARASGPEIWPFDGLEDEP